MRVPLLLLLLLPSAIRGDGCWPGDYEYNHGDPFNATLVLPLASVPRGYCIDFFEGGRCGDSVLDSGFTFFGSQCKRKGLIWEEDCACGANFCTNSGGCGCVSSHDPFMDFCYRNLAPCASCPPPANDPSPNVYRFRVGCGCVNCRTARQDQLDFYNGAANPMQLAYRCANKQMNGWICGPGTCQICPPGASCGDNSYATPCAPGYFQPREGQPFCNQCVLTAADTYLARDVDAVAACHPVTGWSPSIIRTCTPCTSFSVLPPLLPSGTPSSLCPAFRKDFGLYKPAPTISECRPCTQCVGKQYARPTAAERYCVTDLTTTQCVEMYNAKTQTNGYTCTSDGASCTPSGETLVVGPMPWLAGFVRTLSVNRYVPGTNNGGLLPTYQPCRVRTSSSPDAAAQAYIDAYYKGRYAPRASSRGQLNAMDWSRDCQPDLTRECAPGHYAVVLQGYTDESTGLSILEECRPCSGGGTSDGGMQPYCVCPPGYTTYAALDAQLPGLSIIGGNGLGRDPQTCIDCLRSVAWQHSPTPSTTGADLWHEALVCPGPQTQAQLSMQNRTDSALFLRLGPSSLFSQCNGAMQYVTADNVCDLCDSASAGDVCPQVDIAHVQDQQWDNADASRWRLPARSIPQQNRLGCVACPPGTYIEIVSGYVARKTQVYRCVPCPPGTFQPYGGQCACRTRRTACPPGSYVVQDVARAVDATADYECRPCETSCGDHRITIRAPNDINNTCNGLGGQFFACYDSIGDGSGPTLLPGQRLEYPFSTDTAVPQGTLAVVGNCDYGFLPADSVFVTHSVPAAGAECYFACKHGVNPGAAQAFQRGLADYVYEYRRELIPFLPSMSTASLALSASSQSADATPRGVEHIQMPSVWGYDDVVAAGPDNNDYNGPNDVFATSTNTGAWIQSNAWHVDTSNVADLWQNTFLFIEDFLQRRLASSPSSASASPLCTPAAEAYSLACPTGFVSPPTLASYNATAMTANCALRARTDLFRITRGNLVSYATLPPAAVHSGYTAAAPVCVAHDTELSRFQVGCSLACLDRRYLEAYRVQRRTPPSNTLWFERLSWLTYLLQSSFWSQVVNMNPYDSTVTGLSSSSQWFSLRETAPSTTTVAPALLATTPAPASSFTSSPSSTNSSSSWSASSSSSAGFVSTAIGTTPSPVIAVSPVGASSSAAACQTRCALRPASPDGRAAAFNTFRYSTNDHQGDGTLSLLQNVLPTSGITACAPCDYGGSSDGIGKAICQTLFNPPRFFRNDLCVSPPAGTTELTTDLVCSVCPLNEPNGGTLLSTNANATGPYYEWWIQRRYNARDLSFASAVVDGLYAWQAIQCRYACPAGFTSNNADPASYAKQPCVPCPSMDQICSTAVMMANTRGIRAMFLDLPSDNGGSCGEPGNFIPYVATCKPCDSAQVYALSGAPMYVFESNNPTEPVVGSAAECRALCNPKGYLSFDTRQPDAPPITALIPIAYLRCTPCSSNPSFSCEGKCADGAYYNASLAEKGLPDCVSCTTEPCAQPGYYREKCFAGVAVYDAMCLPCPAARLYNTPLVQLYRQRDADLLAIAPDPRLHDALVASDQRVTRRWLSTLEQQTSPAPRVWAVPSPHPEQCSLVCVNNHAWINLTSAVSPFTQADALALYAAPEMACLPCQSALIVDGGDPLLFSVWSDRNISAELPQAAPGSALESMRGLLGGCATCPDFGVRNVVATSKRMCELLPGFTSAFQPAAAMVNLTVTTVLSIGGSTGTTAQIDEPLPLVPVRSAPPASKALASLNRRRRSLLQTANAEADEQDDPALGQSQMLRSDLPVSAAAQGAVQIKTVVQQVPVARMPVLAGQDHLTCCDGGARGQLSPPERERCLLLLSQSVGGDGGLSALSSSSSCAASSSGGRRRALLQYVSSMDAAVQDWLVNHTGSPPSQACHGGTYKPERGDAPCYFCPVGSSTSGPYYAGANHIKNCVCLPGYFAVRSPLPASSSSAVIADTDAAALETTLERCMPCPNGTYRAWGQNDTTCTPCPARMYTPSDGSSYCLCLPGTYPNLVYDACTPCEAGFYCSGNERRLCPDHSLSPVGAVSRADCVCDPTGWYGDLSLSSAVCLPRPPGFVCLNATGSSAASSAGCGCASGWIQQRLSNLAVRCISPCSSGQYAQLRPRSQDIAACVPCPVDTYASDGSLVDACTPCPVGRGTRGRVGMTSERNCSCLAGQTNDTSSSCVGCAAGDYFDVPSGQCLSCPSGWTSSPNTVGRIRCLCPRGAYALANQCAPCPPNTYSHTLGLACTSCPPGCMTLGSGQTSIAACRCHA